MNNKPIKIDVSLIPEREMRYLAEGFLDFAKKFYEKPENVEAFNKWNDEGQKSGKGKNKGKQG